MQPFFLMLIKGQAVSKMSIVNSIDKIGEVLIPEEQGRARNYHERKGRLN